MTFQLNKNGDVDTLTDDTTDEDKEIAGYKYYKAGCLTGVNLKKETGQTISSCADKCNKNSQCGNFEFYANYGGPSKEYKAGDCQLQKPKAFDGKCNGKHHNQDLYIKLDQSGVGVKKGAYLMKFSAIIYFLSALLLIEIQ